MDNLREEIEKIIKTQQDYTRECTLANGTGIQESIDKPNREYATDQILTLLDKEIQKARINELGRAEHYMLKQFGRSLYYDERMAELEKGE